MPSSVSVRLGEHRISTPIDCETPGEIKSCFTSDPVIQDIEPLTIKLHENYDKVKKVHDIALITLKKNVYFHPNKTNVGTICLPVNQEHMIENLEKDDGQLMMTIAGWGYTEEKEERSDVLKFAHIPFLDYEECSGRYSRLRLETASFKTVVDETHLVKLKI